MVYLLCWLNGLIDKINNKSQVVRSRIFRPLLKILMSFGITANRLTAFRIFLGLVFLVVSFWDIAIAGIILIITLCLDVVDGSLARFEKKASDRGKFFDMLADHIIYSLVLLTIIRFSALTYSLAYNLFIVPITYLLAIVYHNELRASDWIIKPYAKCGHLKFVVVIPYIVFVFSRVDFIVLGLWASNITATLMSVYFYYFIQSRKFRK